MEPVTAWVATALIALGPVAYAIVKIVGALKNRASFISGDVALFVAFALGVGYAFLAHLNLIGTVPGAPAAIADLTGNVALIVSGVVLGADAAYLYDRANRTPPA